MKIKLNKGAKIGAVIGFIVHLIWHDMNNIPLLSTTSPHILIGLVTVAVGALIGGKLIKWK